MDQLNQSQQKTQKKDSRFAGFLLLLFAALIATYVLHDHFSAKSKKPMVTRKGSVIPATSYENNVNLHLRMLEASRQIARQRVELDNRKTAPIVEEGNFSNEAETYWHLDMQPEEINARVLEDIKRDTHIRETPDGQIQEYLADQERRIEYEKAYREEFVRAYKENARRKGYEVIINKDLIVEDVRPIRNPSSVGPSVPGGVR